MGYNYKNIDKRRQEAPFLILERNIYENLNVGVIAKVVDTYEGGVKLKSLPEEVYFDASYSLVNYNTKDTKITYSKGDLVVVMFLDKYGVKELTDTSKYIMHDYKNAVIVGKVSTVKDINEDKGLEDNLVTVSMHDFSQAGTDTYVRVFTNEEVELLKASTLTNVKLTYVFFDDVISAKGEDNFVILKRRAQQKGVFGIQEDPNNTYDLYYEGVGNLFGTMIRAVLILSALNRYGYLVLITDINSLRVNDGRVTLDRLYVATSLGSQGQVPVSTGDNSDPFTYRDFHSRITGPISFKSEGLSNAEIGNLIKEHPTVKLYYEKINGSVKTIYNLNYKCEYDESTQTYTVEIYYFDGGSLVQLIPPSNRMYTLYYEYFE